MKVEFRQQVQQAGTRLRFFGFSDPLPVMKNACRDIETGSKGHELPDGAWDQQLRETGKEAGCYAAPQPKLAVLWNKKRSGQ